MPRLRALFLFTLSLPAACGGDDTQPGPRAKITVSTAREPLLIAFRDGPFAAWRTPTASTTGEYAFDVHGPYVVTVVCDEQGYITTDQRASTPDDDRDLDMACLQWAPDDPFQVSGKMVQPGMVNLGSSLDFSSTPDWEFHLTAGGGPLDLLAISSDRIAIRRGLLFASDATVPKVDVEQEGVALVPTAFVASNATAADSLTVTVALSTATSGWFVYDGPPADAKIAPDEILIATDDQSVFLFAEQGDLRRFVVREHREGDPTTLALPDPIEGAQLSTRGGQVVATWDRLPDFDTLRLSVDGVATGGIPRTHHLVLSRSYVAVTGATEVVLETELETEVPGYRPGWRIDLGQEHTIWLNAVRNEAGAAWGSTASKTVEAPQ